MKHRRSSHCSWTTATTFAEAGEWDIARTFIPVGQRSRLLAWLEKFAMAAALAEEGLREDALRVADLGPMVLADRASHFLELCGLDDIRCTFGAVAPNAIGVRA
ncbi:MAG: hypothetical protein AB1568_06910 [Thermodesulfobacteriota bacterium]